METMYMIGFFLIMFVIVLVVGFIGNRIVDGTRNAFVRHKAAHRKTDPRDEAVSENLADRYR